MALAQAAPPAASATKITAGAVIPSVVCAEEPEQTYALYLPSYFTPDRAWPMILAFDPAARGSLPVEMMKDAAEKYGYIVAGSNNSRNGPFPPTLRAAAAVGKDVSTRFPVDAKRIYFTGFSGGARVAVSVARVCQGCAAGVILHGAGFPWEAPPDKDVQFAVFSAIGTLDFNYSEMIPLQERLDELGITHRLRRFDGPHDWAPPEVWMEAIQWLHLVGMKQGRVPRDDAFIVQQLTQRTARAAALQAAGDPYAAWQEYRDITRDFEGLASTQEAAIQAATLEAQPATREGRQAEHKEIEEEKSMLRDFDQAFDRLLRLPDDRPFARAAVEAEVETLRRRHQREIEKDGAASTVTERCFTQVRGRLFEAGDQARREKDYSLAVVQFEIWSHLLPGQPAPFYHLGRTYAAAGKKKDALKALRKARQLGFNRPEFLSHEDFASLQSDREFQQLLAEMKKGASGQ